MDKLNQYEETVLGTFIAILLKLAHWLFRMLIFSGLLWLASLVPVLSGPVTSILLELVLWSTIFIAGFILTGNILAYYYVIGCARNNLERYTQQAKRRAGK